MYIKIIPIFVLEKMGIVAAPYRVSSIKTGITYPYSHSHIAPGPSSPVSLLPAGSAFIVSVWVRTLFLLSGSSRSSFFSFSRANLLSFSRRFPSPWVPLSSVSSVSRSFPSLPWRCVGLCVIAFRLFPSRSSRLGIRAVGRGGVACSVGCGFVPWRGVAWVGGAFYRFAWRLVSYGAGGGDDLFAAGRA